MHAEFETLRTPARKREKKMAEKNEASIESLEKMLENWDKEIEEEEQLEKLLHGNKWWEKQEEKELDEFMKDRKRRKLEKERQEEEEWQRLIRKAQHIVAVIDIDGHMINKQFVPKEMAIKALGSKRPLPVFFYNEYHPYKDLNAQDQRTCDYVMRNVYDLPYWKWWYGMLKPQSIDKIFRLVCKWLYTVDPFYQYHDTEPWVIAFKGGHYEKDVLTRLNMPYINLEDLGCPKVEKIREERHYGTCGMHQGPKHLNKHCPVMEVQLFEQWLFDFMDRENKTLHNRDYELANPYKYITVEDYARPPYF